MSWGAHPSKLKNEMHGRDRATNFKVGGGLLERSSVREGGVEPHAKFLPSLVTINASRAAKSVKSCQCKDTKLFDLPVINNVDT